MMYHLGCLWCTSNLRWRDRTLNLQRYIDKQFQYTYIPYNTCIYLYIRCKQDSLKLFFRLLNDCICRQRVLITERKYEILIQKKKKL